jgi:hypothetical protein
MSSTATPDRDTTALLRSRDAPGSRVTFIELFFDLVYVFAITQLSHLLLGHLTPRGAAQSLVLLLAVWWAWIDTCWVTNWFDPDYPAVRLLLVGIMLASLVMSAAVRGRRATPGQRAPAELPADPDLAGGGGHPLAGRGLRSWAGAGGVLGHGGGRGIRGAAGEVRHTRARTLSDDGLDDRRFAHGRSMPAVHHHLAG